MYVEVGKIVGVWGVKGWLKLHSYTRNRGDIATYNTWYLTSVKRDQKPDLEATAQVTPYQVETCKTQGRNIVAQLANLDDRNAAEALIGRTILVKQDDLPSLDDDEFYWHELIGLTVVNSLDGKTEELGTLSSIMETGANDVLVITPSDQAKEKVGSNDILIPYIDSAVEQVDLVDKTILVNWDLSYLDD